LRLTEEQLPVDDRRLFRQNGERRDKNGKC